MDALGLDAEGRLYLSTTGSFSVSGVNGADEDVFIFTPTSLGSNTSGSFDSARFFHGSLHGLSGNDLYGIDIPSEPAGEPPVAEANGAYSGDEGAPISFSSVGSSDLEGPIVSYAWDFGDGDTGTGAAPSHAYADNGGYTVTLTVTDDDGIGGQRHRPGQRGQRGSHRRRGWSLLRRGGLLP